jgi:hypothetical protein
MKATVVVKTPRYKVWQKPNAALESEYGHVESVLEELPLAFVVPPIIPAT